MHKWWAELSNDDRARMIIPIINMVTNPYKPWKGTWEDLSKTEFENVIQLMREQRKAKIEALETAKVQEHQLNTMFGVK